MYKTSKLQAYTIINLNVVQYNLKSKIKFHKGKILHRTIHRHKHAQKNGNKTGETWISLWIATFDIILWVSKMAPWGKLGERYTQGFSVLFLQYLWIYIYFKIRGKTLLHPTTWILRALGRIWGKQSQKAKYCMIPCVKFSKIKSTQMDHRLLTFRG